MYLFKGNPFRLFKKPGLGLLDPVQGLPKSLKRDFSPDQFTLQYLYAFQDPILIPAYQKDIRTSLK